jgi:hypothetical protein
MSAAELRLFPLPEPVLRLSLTDPEEALWALRDKYVA